MKKSFLIIFLLSAFSTSVFAQETLFPRKDKAAAIANKKRYKPHDPAVYSTIHSLDSAILSSIMYGNIEDSGSQDSLNIQDSSHSKFPKKKSHNSDFNDIEGGIIIYASILRYKGIPIDITPITRTPYGDWEFDKIHHRFNRNKVEYVDAEALLNYGWKDEGAVISYYYSYFYDQRPLPPNFSKKIEEIIIKF